MLTIETIIDAKPGVGQVHQDIDGTLMESSIKKGKLVENKIKIQNGIFEGYGEDSWSTGTSELTKSLIKDFRIKGFIGIGPYGFFSKPNNEIGVKTPIKRTGTLPSLDSVVITDNGEFINYTMIGNHQIYDTIRIVMNDGVRKHEFLVKNGSGSIFKPYDMHGEYSVTAIGYKNNIQQFSEPTKPTTITILPQIV